MKTKKNQNVWFLAFIILFMTSNFVNAGEKKDSPEKQRKEIQKTKKNALNELYKLYPKAKSEIANSKGYAIFGNTGVNLLLLATSRGGGVAHDNTNGKETYMKMISGGVGIGLGVKKYYAIFIFSTTKALNSFIDQGWSAETQADAAAKTENQGDAVAAGLALSPDVMLYQITDVGFAAQATIQGTKYLKNKDLN
jgi:lipid-binding SYLF domain-containing protein